MFKSLFRVFGIGADESELDKFEPIYGLPKPSLDEWLSRNPELKKKYDIELAARLQNNLAVRDTRSPCNEWVWRFWEYLISCRMSAPILRQTRCFGGAGIEILNSN